MLLSTVQGTKLFIHYIARSTAQLVKHKALNLVDVGSSPMMGATSYDVILKLSIHKVPAQYYLAKASPWGLHIAVQVYMIISTKVPVHYCIMTRPLGATLVEVFMSIRKLQVPGCCKHDNLALGGYICGILNSD